MSDAEDNPSMTKTANLQQGILLTGRTPSTCWLQTKAHGTRTIRGLCYSEQRIKREPVIKTELHLHLRLHHQQHAYRTKLKLPLTIKPESYSHSAPESCKEQILVYCTAAAAKYRGTVIDRRRSGRQIQLTTRKRARCRQMIAMMMMMLMSMMTMM
jgi:hypothetical protein